jgi:NAD(P)-dependent dehydrogenase (short-subunit alcohol dehydrogenase family)
VVPADWIAATLATRVPASDGMTYGRQWWQGRFRQGPGAGVDFIAGIGNGGQRLCAVPALDLVVVINAGVYGPRTQGLQPPTEADFDTVMHTNVLAAMRLLPALAEVLAPGARLGVLSSRMGSIGARVSSAGWLYRASKAALNSVLKDASLLLAGRAICVALHPGWVQTDMGGSGAELTVERSAADLRATLARLTPADNGGFVNHDGQPIPW